MIIDYLDLNGNIATTRIINSNDPLAFANAADLSGMPYLIEKFGPIKMEVRKELDLPKKQLTTNWI